MKIAFFGQAPFGKDCLVRILEAGHEVVGVYAPPEGARPDPLAEEAKERGLPLFRHKRFRRKGEAIPELVDEHAALGADLNLLAFVTVILPPEIVDAPPHGSLCFHPSLLPEYRGGNALAWQIMLGAKEAGVTVFRPDAGVDTGPIVVQKGPVPIEPHHTSASLYFEALYDLGVEAVVEAVNAVADGSAHYAPQDESRASHQGLVTDEDARIDWRRDAATLDRQVRGCDPNPGAWALRDGETIRLYGGRLEADASGTPGEVLEVGEDGALVAAVGGGLRIARVKIGDGRKLPAAEAGLARGDRLA
ncbi:MAG: methionyl-tRNA formyltransferase [Myxococcota bacterium]